MSRQDIRIYNAYQPHLTPFNIFWIFKVVIDTIVVEGVTLRIDRLSTYLIAGFLFGLINWVEHLLIRNKK